MNYDQIKSVFLPSAQKYVANLKTFQDGTWNEDRTIFTVKSNKLGHEGYSITVRQPTMRDFTFVIWMDINDKVSVEVYAGQGSLDEDQRIAALRTVLTYIDQCTA